MCVRNFQVRRYYRELTLIKVRVVGTVSLILLTLQRQSLNPLLKRSVEGYFAHKNKYFNPIKTDFFRQLT